MGQSPAISGIVALPTCYGSGSQQVLPTSNLPQPIGGSPQIAAAQQIPGGPLGLTGSSICLSGGSGSANSLGNPSLGSGSIGGGIPFCLSGAGATPSNPIPTASQQPGTVQPTATSPNFNSYEKQYSAVDPSVLPQLLSLDTALRPRFKLNYGGTGDHRPSTSDCFAFKSIWVTEFQTENCDRRLYP